MSVFTWFDVVVLIRKTRLANIIGAWLSRLCIACKCCFILFLRGVYEKLAAPKGRFSKSMSKCRKTHLSQRWTQIHILTFWHLSDTSFYEAMWKKWNFNDSPRGEKFGTRVIFQAACMNPTLFSAPPDLKINTTQKCSPLSLSIPLALSLFHSHSYSLFRIQTHTHKWCGYGSQTCQLC